MESAVRASERKRKPPNLFSPTSNAPQTLKRVRKTKSPNVLLNALKNVTFKIGKAKPKTVAATSKRPRQIPSTGNFPSVPNIQRYIVNKSSSVAVNRTNYDLIAWAGMYGVLSYLSTEDYVKFMKKMTVERLNNLHTQFKDNANTYRKSDPTNGEFDITLENAVNILFSVWLDGVHDKYIASSFLDFLDSDYCKEYFIVSHRNAVKEYISKNKTTKYITKILSIRQDLADYFTTGEGLRDNWEPVLKTSISSIFKSDVLYVENAVIAFKESVGQRYLYLSIDHEAPEQTSLSSLVNDSPLYTNNTRMIHPYLTIGSILDRGQRKIAESIVKDLTRMFSDKPSINLMYYVSPFSLDFKLMGVSFFKVTINLRIPAQSNIKKPPAGDFFDIKLNGKPVTSGSTRKLATIGNVQDKAGKFFGDGLQYLIIGFQNSSQFRAGTTKSNIRAFATGDAMAFTNYLFFSRLMGVNNAPGIIDSSKQARKLFYVFNMNRYVERVPYVKRYANQKRSGSVNINTSNNTTNNATSKPRYSPVFPKPTRNIKPLTPNKNKNSPLNFNANALVKLLTSPEAQKYIRNQGGYKKLMRSQSARKK
jgi:hypothetical protein